MLSFFPRGVLHEILNLIESVSEEFPSYSFMFPRPRSRLQLNVIGLSLINGVSARTQKPKDGNLIKLHRKLKQNEKVHMSKAKVTIEVHVFVVYKFCVCDN